MDIFKINKKAVGRIYKIRLMYNPKNLNRNIIPYKVFFADAQNRWIDNYMCYAVVNNELKIFSFSENIYKMISTNMFLTNSKVAIVVSVDAEFGITYELEFSNSHELNNPEEKLVFIKSIIKYSEFSLEDAVEREKSKIGRLEIRIPQMFGGYNTTTLKEVYEKEKIYNNILDKIDNTT